MATLTRYSSFKKLKQTSSTDLKKAKRKTVEAETKAFFQLLKKTKTGVKKA